MRVKNIIRCLFALLLVLLCTVQVETQTNYVLYLPTVGKPERTMAGNWHVVDALGTQNRVLNPEARTTGNFAAEGAATVNRHATAQFYGIYSYHVQTGADNQGIQFTLGALDNAIYYVTMVVDGTLPGTWDWSLDNANWNVPTALETYGNWVLYGYQFPAAQANASTTLRVHQNGAGGGDFYLDGIQVEKLSYWTTFCSGARDGCEWDGAANASTSTRSAHSRAGGRVREMEATYSFYVDQMIGVGANALNLAIDSYAILPGGELNSIKNRMREFVLAGTITGTNLADLHANRQALLEVLSNDRSPEQQPIRLRYDGAAVEKEIQAYYAGGLDGQIRAVETRMEAYERVTIRFVAVSPFFYDIGESGTLLDVNDTATLRYITGRLKSTGQWDDLGLTSNPTVGSDMYVVYVASDHSVYVGCYFTGWNGVAGRDVIARYIPSTDTWETVGNAGDFFGGGNAIWDIIEGPDGTIYVCGTFINAAGDANADYIAQWNGTAWSAVGIPNAGAASITEVLALAFDHAGNLLVGGDFTNWANVAAADYIALWNGTAWSAVGTGGTGTVADIAVDSEDNYYIGGTFTNWAADADADYIAWWNGTVWAAVTGSAFNSDVYALEITDDDVLYIGGDFTDGAGISEADYIVEYDGNAFSALGTGFNNKCYRIRRGPDGMIYTCGMFTTAGGIDIVNQAAKWNGASWAHLDVDLPGSPTVRSMDVGHPDPVLDNNYSVYLGHSTSGAGTFAGAVIIPNNGNTGAYPRIVVKRTGGTSATLEEIRNETLGLELLFDYDLQDGETLTIDLDPTKQSVVSSFFGPRLDALLPNSDFGQWRLQPGDNTVTCFVDIVNAPAIEAYVVWADPYSSLD